MGANGTTDLSAEAAASNVLAAVASEERLRLLETRLAALADATDTSWVISAAALVILMQLGFAMLEAGTVRVHNVITTYCKNVVDFVVATLVACLWGYQIAYNVNPLALGEPSERSHEHERFVIHVAFQAVATTIVSGAMAERTTVLGYGVVSVLVSTVFCIGVRLTWGGGWLNERGFIDTAGSGVVHLLSGAAALAGIYAVGPRMGRWDLAMQSSFVPNSIPSVITGALLLFVGWFGLNPGSTLGMASQSQRHAAAASAMATVLAASSSTMAMVTMSLVSSRGRRLDIMAATGALLSGLVSITAGCDVIDPWASLIVGAVAAPVFRASSVMLRSKLRIDDVVDAFAVRGATGAWGCVAVGLFHRHEGLLVAGRASLLGSQLLGCVVLASLGGGITLLGALVLRRLGCLRCTEETEIIGLDNEFGLSPWADTERSRKLQRCAGAANLLQKKGFSPVDVVDALYCLREIICRPFTPQAADYKLDGEVMDILRHLSGEPSTRIACDANEDEGQQPDAYPIISSLPLPPISLPPSAHNMNKTDNTRPLFTRANTQPMAQPKVKVKHVAFLSHHKEDAGDGARIFKDTASRLLSGTQGWGAQKGAEELQGSTPKRLRQLAEKEHIENLIYLDSAELKDLNKLLDDVEASANYIIMLSRHVLERPWVLAELCAAHKSGKNIIAVLVEYPRKQDDPKAFRHPLDLEAAISEWREFANTASKGRRRSSRKMRVVSQSVLAISRRGSRDLCFELAAEQELSEKGGSEPDSPESSFPRRQPSDSPEVSFAAKTSSANSSFAARTSTADSSPTSARDVHPTRRRRFSHGILNLPSSPSAKASSPWSSPAVVAPSSFTNGQEE